jgi:hypothetical protein
MYFGEIDKKIVAGVVFPAVCVVSKENALLIIPRTSCSIV